MSNDRTMRALGRRPLLASAAAAALATATSAGRAQTSPAPRRSKRLRILQPNHFVPAFDDWFNNSFIKEWGERNDTEVLVTNVGMTAIDGRAEMESRRGSATTSACSRVRPHPTKIS